MLSNNITKNKPICSVQLEWNCWLCIWLNFDLEKHFSQIFGLNFDLEQIFCHIFGLNFDLEKNVCHIFGLNFDLEKNLRAYIWFDLWFGTKSRPYIWFDLWFGTKSGPYIWFDLWFVKISWLWTGLIPDTALLCRDIYQTYVECSSNCNCNWELDVP